jgi:septum formation protein
VIVPPLVLASASPRRRGLLTALGVAIDRVQPAHIDESVQPGEAPLTYAARLAREKADVVGSPGEVVLAADTVVHFEGRIFGKPVDHDDARAILRSLSGRWHSVTTGYCVLGPDRVPVDHGVVTARVRFRTLTEPMIEAYVQTGEGRDKAGGYGVQGLGAALVVEVDGSASTVVGLPMGAVLPALARVGVEPRRQKDAT